MFIKNLTLTNFKNYEFAEMEFSPKINCFVGNNGVGKTNVLDAVHYISLAKSFFNNIDSLSIKHGEDYFIIQGTLERGEEEDLIYCAFQKQKQKLLRRNGKDYAKLSDHIGRFPVVMISPADSALISEGSEERRRFMNKIISQYNPEYLDAVLMYNKALQHRNKLLKDFRIRGTFDAEMLEIWDSQLIKHGNYIFSQRQILVHEMVPVFQENYSLISSDREQVRLEYKSHLSEGPFEKLLSDSVPKDRALEYTSTGIHKDDLIFTMNGYPVKLVGSQGQQKSYLVALKLAKFDYIRHKAGYPPILLLDDIFDKFDADRVEQIIRLVSDNRFGQIFITDTNGIRLHDILTSHNADYRLFGLTEGHAELISHNGN